MTMELAGDCLGTTEGSVPNNALNDTSRATGKGRGGGCWIGTAGSTRRLVTPQGVPEVGSRADDVYGDDMTGKGDLRHNVTLEIRRL